MLFACATVHHLLQHLQSEVGYSSICLFADKDKPHIGAMYQVRLPQSFRSHSGKGGSERGRA